MPFGLVCACATVRALFCCFCEYPSPALFGIGIPFDKILYDEPVVTSKVIFMSTSMFLYTYMRM